MKSHRILSPLILFVLAFAMVRTVKAQLGDTDASSVIVQNISSSTATVTVRFVNDYGGVRTPPTFKDGQTNPFTLQPSQSYEIYLPGIPLSATGLPDGRYSVVIESNGKLAVIAKTTGQSDTDYYSWYDTYFNGSFSGFANGASSFYLPAVVYNYYGWYSLISIQNVGSALTNITVTIKCQDGSTHTHTRNNLGPKVAEHLDLEINPPSTLIGRICNGSAVITSSSGQPIVAIDNQSVPIADGGHTQSYSGVSSGASTLYVPALYHAYYGWNSSLNIRKLSSGSTEVTVSFSDQGSETCYLTDSNPGCMLYMPAVHPAMGYFAATITSNPARQLAAVANAANNDQAQTYNAVSRSASTNAVAIPSVIKAHYGWNSSFTCQNVGTVSTSLRISYYGYSGYAYNTGTLSPGQTIEKYVPSESFLPNGYLGSVIVTANNSYAYISCIVNFNNGEKMATTRGDWSTSYNAFNK